MQFTFVVLSEWLLGCPLWEVINNNFTLLQVCVELIPICLTHTHLSKNPLTWDVLSDKMHAKLWKSCLTSNVQLLNIHWPLHCSATSGRYKMASWVTTMNPVNLIQETIIHPSSFYTSPFCCECVGSAAYLSCLQVRLDAVWTGHQFILRVS